MYYTGPCTTCDRIRGNAGASQGAVHTREGADCKPGYEAVTRRFGVSFAVQYWLWSVLFTGTLFFGHEH